ncbi:intercellular trafficking and secretion [Clydaea vesicula]|uniref:Sorting nexin-4 n=1 Tax=Clydaea vesicula TaxID=447962 RepID=A0AAD5TWD6_9FUNG|nr:intercellular trafficking and secretion [Clydaea vesicula]
MMFSTVIDSTSWEEEQSTTTSLPSVHTNVENFTENRLTITLTEPRKNGDGSSGYISYLILTKTTLKNFSQKEYSVRRRFQDFINLHKALSEAHPASILPPAPGKHRMEYITGDRFSQEFIEKRRTALQSYLQRLSRHPILQKSEVLKTFLTEDLTAGTSTTTTDLDGEQKSTSRQRSNSSSNKVFESFSEVLLNAFSKVKVPDQKFLDLKGNIDNLEENLISVEKAHHRLLKQQTELEQDMTEFANCVIGLSEMETQIKLSINDFGKIVRNVTIALKDKLTVEETVYLNCIQEYISYCQQVKEVLKTRDQKQVDVEELDNYLKNHIADRDRTMSTSRFGGNRLTEFLQGKFQEIKGVDSEVARQQKLDKLALKITEVK